MRRSAVRWLAAFAVLGLVSSIASAVVHYRLLAEPNYVSFCDVTSTVSCTQAYASRYGSLAGVPVALLGVIFFAAASLLVAATALGPDGLRDSAPAYLFVLSTAGLAVVLYLAHASLFVLGTLCPLCVATYAGVIGLFMLSGITMTVPVSALPRRLLRDLRSLAASPAAAGLLLAFIAGATFAVAFFPRERSAAAATREVAAGPAVVAQGRPAAGTAPQSEFERWFEQQPVADPGVPADGAAVVIVKFNDYQCPPCGQSYFDYKSVLAKYQAERPGAVKFVTRDFPLDPECNFNAPGGTHLAACEAAVAVRLARRHGRAAELEEWLFTNQPTLTPDRVRQAARDVGGVTDFDAQYARVLQEVKADIAAGGALGVRSTPTFFINGRLIRGALPARYFDEAIAYELKRARK
ncbi:MAG TPA: vitamin K epoxide reductase family protein [Vicinamibacterales bacterium]|nr:vitamin K epoxide reductase family protein [Vicinamibacterales bacterium]